MAVARALEQYLFCVSRIDTIVLANGSFRFFLNDLEYLPVNDIATADHSEDRKNGGKYSPGSRPSVDHQPDKETEADTSGHGQPDLHDNGQVFGPCPVFPVFEK